MTLFDILQDIHALQEDLLMYERKYNTLSDIFYESYMQGEEPPDDTWVLDWAGWAGTYQILQRRRKQYAVPQTCVARHQTQPHCNYSALERIK